MINLCDSLQYYKDSNLGNEANRTPRSNEDIEIIGIIPVDETIDMESLSSCGLSTIGALTMTFNSGTNILHINSSNLTKSGIDPLNPRAPTGVQLSGIIKNNPLRAEHGWYTITSDYKIGSLITNSIVSISNIGLNNDSIVCNTFNFNNSIYANGFITTNKIIFNNTKFYGATLECANISGSNNTKIDTVLARSEIFNLNNSSIADSTIESSQFFANNSRLIDCAINYGSCNLTNCIIQGNMEQNLSGFTIVENCNVGNSSGISSANIITESLKINNSKINGDSKIITNTLYGSGNLINRNATVQTEYLKDNSTWNNSGTFRIENTNPLVNPIINNNGLLSIGQYVKCQLVQSSGRTEISNSGISIGGYNAFAGTIQGNIFIGSGGFNNNGKIITDNCIIQNGVNDISGLIKNLQTVNCINKGIVSNGLFISSSAINSGYVDIGIFQSGAINDGSGNNLSFYNGSNNKGSGNIVSLYNSLNNGNIILGQLYNNSINSGFFIQLDLYDTSINNGNGRIINVYNSGINNSVNVSTGNFYNTSSCGGIGVGQSAINYSFYNFSKIISSTNGGSFSIFKFYDSSSVQSSLNCATGIFYSNSSIRQNGQGNFGSGYFYNKFINSGILKGNLYFYDTSSNNGNIDGLTSNNIQFNDKSLNNGIIRASGGTNLVISFNNTSNNGTIIAGNNVSIIFNNGKNNGSIITSSGTISFINSSSNYGKVCGQYTYDQSSNDYGTSSASC